MKDSKKLAVSILIGVLILIGVFAVIALTPSGLFTGAMRNFNKITKSSKQIPWWCATPEEKNKKYNDYWCNMNPAPKWTEEWCKDGTQTTETLAPGGQTLSPGTIKFFQSGKFPIDPNFAKWAKMYKPKDSSNGMIVGNVPQPETPKTDTIPPEDKNEGSSESPEQTPPEETGESWCEYLTKNEKNGTAVSFCNCGEKMTFEPECNRNFTCGYWPADYLCNSKWQCPNGYVPDEWGVHQKCDKETTHIKELTCAGKQAKFNPKLMEICKAFGEENKISNILNEPSCVKKGQCKHLKKLLDEGISTPEALAQLGLSGSEAFLCANMYTDEWSNGKPW